MDYQVPGPFMIPALHRAIEKQQQPLTEALVIHRAEGTAKHLIYSIFCAHHIYSMVSVHIIFIP